MGNKPTKEQKAKAIDDIKETKGSRSSAQEADTKKDLQDQYQYSFDALSTVRQTWDDKESMLIGVNRDSLSINTTKSQVNDPRLATIVIERAARVMAQLPTGKVQALTQKDKGKNSFMNLVVNKYIYPNANAQFELLTKFRMWDIYSGMYGSMPMLVDYRISDDYIGPDCYLVPMRSFLPQPGRVSIQESDYAFVENWVSVDWLEKRNPKFWKNLDGIIKDAKEKGGSTPANQDQQKRSFIERNQFPYLQGGKGRSAMVRLGTRYEKDHWVTFAPDNDFTIVRDIENPQHNNRIPIVMKHCFPLLESIIGLGEFERGKSLQFAINSLINLYMDGVKMSIFPPIMIDPTGVVPSSIKFNPAQKWLVTKPGSINPFQVSPQGINTFQSTYSFLIAALLNMAGTTDTSTTAKTDPGMGKTPEAIAMLSQRESSRDNWDRYMMEKAVEETFDIMVDMVATTQEKPMELELFSEEIKQIEKNSPDIKEMLQLSETGNYAKVRITPKQLRGAKYRFFIDAGTSMKQDDAETNETAQNLLAMFIKNPQLVQAIAQDPVSPKRVNFGELVEVVVNTSGLPNANKIVEDITPQPQQVQDQAQQPPQPNVHESMNFKDMPPAGQAQMAEQAGIKLSPQDLGVQPQQPMPGQMPPGAMPGQPMPQQPMQPGAPEQAPQIIGGHQFKNPEIAALAQKLMGGQGGAPANG